MMNVVCEVLQKQAIQQVIYISSDAVYADSDQPLTETSVIAPTSLHGVMHLTREMMLQSVCSENNISLAILRPSLLYGAEDPHNGYRPFDITDCQKAFPDFSYTGIEDGLRYS